MEQREWKYWKVLIVAKCIVNLLLFSYFQIALSVLIVAKCIVNKTGSTNAPISS